VSGTASRVTGTIGVLRPPLLDRVAEDLDVVRRIVSS